MSTIANKMEENVSRYAKYECLKVEVAEKVATVTLNRPQARNAINQKLIRELRTIWDDLADDHAVNAVVLTGAGEFFSVGGDVKAMSERPGRRRSRGGRGARPHDQPPRRHPSARTRQADHCCHQR